MDCKDSVIHVSLFMFFAKWIFLNHYKKNVLLQIIQHKTTVIATRDQAFRATLSSLLLTYPNQL